MNQRLQRVLGRLLSALSKEVYYINGQQTLPLPLSPEEEGALIADMACEEVRAELVERNLRLVVYIAKKFESTGVNIEDLISIGTIGLMKAIASFCPEKNIKLATYASRCIENEILMYMRKNSTRRIELSIDEPLNVDRDGNELLLSDILASDEESVFAGIEREEDRRTIRRALSHLAARERQIITLRFGLDGERERTQKEVADLLGISQSYISRLEKKIISHLREDIGAKI
jgi:RNA polymerase sporulation-specific sigma factor